MNNFSIDPITTPEDRRNLKVCWTALAIIVALIATIGLARAETEADGGSMYRARADQAYASAIRTGAKNAPVRSAQVVGGRPAACDKFPATKRLYCGCASALYVSLPNEDGRWNRAISWFAMPRAAPGPGMAVVRPHHVKIIIGGSPGAWTVYDPNSGGGLTRIYTTATLGGVVVNPHGRQFARLK